MINLKGWRTLGWSALLVVGPVALNWAAGVDWTHYLNPTLALAVAGGVGFALRFVTTTPVGRS